MPPFGVWFSDLFGLVLQLLQIGATLKVEGGADHRLVTQSGGGGGGAEKSFFTVTLYNFQKSGLKPLPPPHTHTPSVGPAFTLCLPNEYEILVLVLMVSGCRVKMASFPRFNNV